jgi:hypothetical protein
MTIVWRAIALFWIATVSACNGPTSPTIKLDEQFVLAPDGAARIAETGISLRFIGVTGDSRCPADAICIQGGDALVRIEVFTEKARSTGYDLHTGDMRPVEHNGLIISLIQLEPYPFSSRSIQPADYRATLRVTRR